MGRMWMLYCCLVIGVVMLCSPWSFYVLHMTQPHHNHKPFCLWPFVQKQTNLRSGQSNHLIHTHGHPLPSDQALDTRPCKGKVFNFLVMCLPFTSRREEETTLLLLLVLLYYCVGRTCWTGHLTTSPNTWPEHANTQQLGRNWAHPIVPNRLCVRMPVCGSAFVGWWSGFEFTANMCHTRDVRCGPVRFMEIKYITRFVCVSVCFRLLFGCGPTPLVIAGFRCGPPDFIFQADYIFYSTQNGVESFNRSTPPIPKKNPVRCYYRVFAII